MNALNKKLINYLRDKNQRFRERICAPVVFKLMDITRIKRHLPFTCTGDEAQELIYQKLMSGKPCMIGRIGSNESMTMEGYLHQEDNFLKKLKWFFSLHQTNISAKIHKIWQTLEDNPDNDKA